MPKHAPLCMAKMSGDPTEPYLKNLRLLVAVCEIKVSPLLSASGRGVGTQATRELTSAHRYVD